MPLRALIIDFNSYFASVEQQTRPELRGKPIAVVPMLSDYTCCIAASYEAKKYGIKTGLKVADAKQACPSLIVVEAQPPLYIDYHHQLIKAVDSCMPVAQVLSIDEMRCNLEGSWRDKDKAIAVAHQIKKAIRSQVGEFLTSSIGIAPNGFLAKTASDMMKPDGLIVLEESDLPHALFDLKLRDLCGIGPGTEQKLLSAGLYTVKDLCDASKAKLHSAWGSIEGTRMYGYLRGENIERPRTKKSVIGHSHVLSPEIRNMHMAEAILNALLQKAAMRLRHEQYLTGCLQVYVEFTGGRTWRENMRFQETSNSLELLKTFSVLWKKCPKFSQHKPVLVGVSFNRLTHNLNTTLSFLEDQKYNKLMTSIDELNLNYGQNTIFFGGAYQALDMTPLRIAFTHVPELLEAQGNTLDEVALDEDFGD